MASTATRERFLHFGPFRLDGRSGELYREGRRVRLPPQASRLLLMLVSSRGELVSREEIQKALWSEDTFVEFDDGINKCVRQIRAALGNGPTSPGYIQTVSRRGYRFLGEVRGEGVEPVDRERPPYPGLSSFTELDAAYFFGREGEVEALWKKIEGHRLLAVMGPSGAGKSSFLRAGLLASCPAGYSAVYLTPGSAPLASVARALVPELSTTPEVIQRLVSLESSESVVEAVSEWRKRSGEVLIVIDALEELFTLNSSATQGEFSRLLGRLASECGAHVLLSMRDDFLFRCHEQEALRPVFTELTPLGTLSGAALRRGLVEPALGCGYRFESEELVEEMLGEVEGERGALPLLAFAASRLWEKRDRVRKLLTREAYEANGRVGGALSQHAEETLEKIGSERASLVRELLRNLVTSQGTRVSREVTELLSIFPKEEERKAAEEVLQQLVASRLLTSYETTGEKDTRERSVEIIHESLLSAWPRLVRWQAQDTEGAVLRDQLRQAVKAWQDRGCPDDLLWTGKPYRELALWREGYAGGLPSIEEAFVQAAAKLAGRKRTRRRIALTSVMVVLLGVVGALASLWMRAVLEVSRREAAQILALGRLDLQDRPTSALAHALASLEHADNEPARRFAVEALWHGASAIVLSGNINHGDFSPDGKWLATGGVSGGVQLWSLDGGAPRRLSGPGDGLGFGVRFSPGSDLLATTGRRVQFRSLPEGREIRTVELEGDTSFTRGGTHLFSFTANSGRMSLRDWSRPERDPDVLASLDFTDVAGFTVDASGEWLATAQGNRLYLSPITGPGSGRSRILGRHEANVIRVGAHPTASRIVSSDEKGEVRIWSISETSQQPERTFRAPVAKAQVYLDSTDSWLTVAGDGPHSTSDVAYVWDLKGPPDVEPVVLRNGNATWMNDATIDSAGQWLFTADAVFGVLWPLGAKHARVLRGQSPPYITVAFSPDGKELVSTSDDGTVRVWPLVFQEDARSRIVMEETALLGATGIAIDPSGRYTLVGSRFDGRVWLVPLEGGVARRLPGEGNAVGPRAFSPDGRLALVAAGRSLLRIWDLESGEVRTLDTLVPGEDGCWPKTFEGSLSTMGFLSDGSILTVGDQGARIWNLGLGTSRKIAPCRDGDATLALDRDRRRALILYTNMPMQDSLLSSYDIETGTFREITSHGNRVSAAALDPTGSLVATGDFDGVVRVGSADGGEPHLLYGHTLEISSIAVSPNGKWIASGSQDGTIRLWPKPKGTPFHRLPYKEILDHLRSFTNLRVVPDESSATGYRVVIGAFPGWKTIPSW